LEGEPSTLKTVQMPTFSPEDLIGHTYLTDPDEDGQCFRARIVCKIEEHEDKTNQHPEKIKFLVSVDENKADEIVSYNDILHFINKEMERDDDQEYWRFEQLVGIKDNFSLMIPGIRFKLQCLGGVGRWLYYL